MLATEIAITPAFGWQGGPEFNTRVTTLRNAQERRNANWATVRHRYILPYKNIRSSAYLANLKALFLAAQGQLTAFLAKDFADFQATGEALGTAPAGSLAVQLKKTYTFGVATYARTITKPVAATVTVYENGTAKAGTLDATTGLFTPTAAWAAGATLTWSGEFRVPVRFASDAMPMTIDEKFNDDGEFAMNGSVELLEVFGE